MPRDEYRVIDLFCGCGGLSVGFCSKPTSDGISFRTVMAVDNWRPAVKVFNQNHVANKNCGVARVADLNWFNHELEVLLYYYLHLGLTGQDDKILEELKKIGFLSFLKSLRKLDIQFSDSMIEVCNDDGFPEDRSNIDASVLSLAIVRSTLYKINLQSGKELKLDLNSILWADEYALLEETLESQKTLSLKSRLLNDYQGICESQWEKLLLELKEASEATGRGQHTNNPARVKSLLDFLRSTSGTKIRSLWIKWQASRRTISEDFCLQQEAAIRALYINNRTISGILGGPPCKGFSRIGRAAIADLRTQGAHAWASADFGDERNALMYKYMLFVAAFEPRFFVFENVAQFASKLKTPNGEFDGSGALIDSINGILDKGKRYSYREKIYKAKEYSIPQARERFILIAVKGENIQDLGDIEKSECEVPLLQALIGLEDPVEFRSDELIQNDTGTRRKCYSFIDENEPSAYREFKEFIRMRSPIDNSIPQETDAHLFRIPRSDDQLLIDFLSPGMRWMDLKISDEASREVLKTFSLPDKVDNNLLIRCILEEISSRIGEKHHMLGSGYLRNGDNLHGDWLQRLSAIKPSGTIIAHIGKDTYGYIHPFASRPISIREAARIQAFPDWFAFRDTGVVDAYTMIGNAVPPLLANKIADRIATFLKKT
jgi:site-specific DNA-cytosine methylase